MLQDINIADVGFSQVAVASLVNFAPEKEYQMKSLNTK